MAAAFAEGSGSREGGRVVFAVGGSSGGDGVFAVGGNSNVDDDLFREP
jgi:hypothetical protein